MSMHDRLIDELVAYDESMARGVSDDQAADSELHQQLRREVGCIRLLGRVWSRHPLGGSDAEADGNGTGAAAVLGAPGTLANSFGRFEIRRLLGQGAHGVVFLAHDPTLGREVALKVPRPDTVVSEDLRARFLREARAAAGLDHPNIVPIYEASHAGAVCYIAEAYCRGSTLAAWLKQRGEPVSAKVAATLVAFLADGIAHAHARGVLHRDLKPANILLDIPIESDVEALVVASDGLGFIPRIADFGLAKLIDKDLDRTKTGVLLGTVNYMAPEQAATTSNDVGAAADIYALGVILYELITGRQPFQGESPLEVLQQVREVEAVPPTRLRGKIPRDLETICLKCLEKGASDRYQSAELLAADLRRFLRCEPIHARPIAAPQRLWRWCRRKPALAAAASLAVSALLVLAAVSVSFAIYQSTANQRLSQEQRQTQLALENARAQYTVAERRSAVLALDRGLGFCQQGDVARGIVWLTRGLTIASALPTAEAGDLVQVIRANLAAWKSELRPLLRAFPHDAEIESLTFSPDGKMVLTDGRDNCVRLWDVSTGGQAGPTLKHPAMVLSAAVSRDRTTVVTGCSDKAVRVWETATGTMKGTPLQHPAAVRTVTFSPDGRLILTGTDDGLRVWNADTQILIQGPLKHGSAVTAIMSLPTDGLVLSCCLDHKARIWEISTGKLVTVFEHAGPVTTCAISPDGQRVLTGGADNTAQFWDAHTAEPIGGPLYHPDRVIFVAFSPDGRVVLTGCGDRKVRYWDPETGEESAPPLTLLTAGNAIAISPDRQSVLTGGSAEPARLWNVFGQQPRGVILRHPDQVRAVAFSPDGTRGLTGCRDQRARLWDLATGDIIGKPMVHNARVLAVAFSPDGRVLLTGSADKTARLWNAHTCEMLGRPLMHEDKVNAVAFSPDGSTVVTGCEDHVVRFWRAHDGSPLPLGALHHGSAVQDVSFGPEGGTMVTSEAANTVRFWDTETAAEVQRHIYSPGRVLGSAASPDGETVLSTSTDMQVRVWSVATGKLIGQPLEHQNIVRDVAFSPDSRIALTGCYDGQARLWDLATHRVIGPRLGHRSNVYAVAYSPDGRSVLTGSWDNTARLWPLATPLQADAKRIEAWVEVLTGMRLDNNGAIHWLDNQVWHRRRQQLRDTSSAWE